MTDILPLIDRLIEEHKVLGEKAKTMETALNDKRLISDISQAGDTIIPGKTDQSERLKALEEMLKSIVDMIEKHFHYEETVLLQAIESHGDAELVKSLNKLLAEHADLQERLTGAKNRVIELTKGNLHRAAFDISQLEMLTSLNYTRAVFQKHATRENKLFSQIRRKIMITQ